MKMVIAVVRPEAADAVRQALLAVDIHKMTVSNVKGCGEQPGYVESHRGIVVEVNLLSKVRFEIAVNESFVKKAVDAIIQGARTNNIGDGKIFVLPIEQCYRIRTGESGNDAIG
ncbi:MAG: P-II family nitrogen regulator [Negativicutes bacterium]